MAIILTTTSNSMRVNPRAGTPDFGMAMSARHITARQSALLLQSLTHIALCHRNHPCGRQFIRGLALATQHGVCSLQTNSFRPLFRSYYIIKVPLAMSSSRPPPTFANVPAAVIVGPRRERAASRSRRSSLFFSTTIFAPARACPVLLRATPWNPAPGPPSPSAAHCRCPSRHRPCYCPGSTRCRCSGLPRDRWRRRPE